MTQRATLQALPGKRYCLTNYTIQCKDVTTGETGCFIFDTDHYRKHGEFKAVSPIYSDLVAFFASPDSERRKPCYIQFEGE